MLGGDGAVAVERRSKTPILPPLWLNGRPLVRREVSL